MATDQLTQQDRASEAWCAVSDAIMDLGKTESVLDLAVADLHNRNEPTAGAAAMARDVVSRIGADLAPVLQYLSERMGKREGAA